MTAHHPPHNMTDAVSRVVHLRLMSGLTDIDGVAAHLKLGVRALQRRLSVEGESYREILAREKYCRAFGLLTDSSLSISEVSRNLGYATVGDFTRFFTRRHGHSSNVIRRKNKK